VSHTLLADTIDGADDDKRNFGIIFCCDLFNFHTHHYEERSKPRVSDT
jgi:hypothetical protein